MIEHARLKISPNGDLQSFFEQILEDLTLIPQTGPATNRDSHERIQSGQHSNSSLVDDAFSIDWDTLGPPCLYGVLRFRGLEHAVL